MSSLQGLKPILKKEYPGCYISSDLLLICLDYLEENVENCFSKYTMVNGIIHGKYISFHFNRKVRLEYNYVFGKLDGTQTEYYGNGNLRQIYEMENGIPCGRVKKYNTSGVLVEDEKYDENKIYIIGR